MMITREFERKYNEMKLSYKNLVNANVDLVDENKNLKEEIERLNNIIKELERLLNNQIENYKDSECEELQAMVQEDKSILFILKELKGSDRE